MAMAYLDFLYCICNWYWSTMELHNYTKQHSNGLLGFVLFADGMLGNMMYLCLSCSCVCLASCICVFVPSCWMLGGVTSSNLPHSLPGSLPLADLPDHPRGDLAFIMFVFVSFLSLYFFLFFSLNTRMETWHSNKLKFQKMKILRFKT